MQGPLQQALPEALLVAIDAPARTADGGGQWFAVEGLDASAASYRLEEARSMFDAVLGQSIEANGFSDRLEAVALVCFSQGADMVLDALLTARWNVGAAVCVAGRLLTADEGRGPVRTRSLLIHGDGDEIIPSDASARAAETLRARNIDVQLCLLPGGRHEVSPVAIEMAARFLHDHFSGQHSVQ